MPVTKTFWRGSACLLLSLGCAWSGGLRAAPSASPEDFIYELQPGDNPWNITARFLAGQQYWPRLLAHNRISDARRLSTGSRLRIPTAWLALRAVDVRLLSVHNQVTLRTAAQGERVAVSGDRLVAGDTLVTGATATATLEIENGSRILVRPGTELSVVQAAGPSGTAGGGAVLVRMQLVRGAIESVVKPVVAPGRFEIQTPAAVAAVRGTEFRVSATPDSTSSEVVTGGVQLANPMGAARLVAGQGTLAQRGLAPQPASALLPAPVLSGLPDGVERLPLDLPLPALAGAVAYRTQVAADAAFTQVLSDTLADAPRVRADEVEDGPRHVRVRGVDARGLEGLAAQRPLQIHARPEPPLLLEPAPQAVLSTEQPSLRWTRAGSARQVRLQLAREAQFAELLLDRTLPDDGGWTLDQALPPGDYHWRLAALDAQRGQGPWGDAQSFRCELPAPGVTAPTPGVGPLVLRWQRLPGATRYHLQLGRDGQFEQPVLDLESKAAQAEVAPLPPGTYAVRVQALGEGGHAGPWSTPQSFTVPEDKPMWPWLLFLIPLWIVG